MLLKRAVNTNTHSLLSLIYIIVNEVAFTTFNILCYHTYVISSSLLVVYSIYVNLKVEKNQISKEFKTDVLKDKSLGNIDKICLIIIYIKMPLIIEGKSNERYFKNIIRRK